MDITSYLLGKQAGGSEPALQEKTVTITQNTTTNVTPDSGYDGLSNVEVTTNVPSGANLSDYFESSISSGGTAAKGYAYMIKRIPANTVVSGTSLEYAFQYLSHLIEMPLIDTSNVTNMANTFNGCSSLTSFPQIDTSKVTTMQRTFYNCTSLTTFPVLNLKRLSQPDLTFYNCPNLTNQSLNNILESLISATSVSSGWKKLSSIGFSSEQAAICTQLSNWSTLESKGWTTGY